MGFYNRQGFTLLELLLVIGLIALLTALVVPNFKPVLDSAQLEQAVQILQADLMKTRQTARAMEEVTRLRIVDGNHYSIETETSPGVFGSLTSSPKRLADGCSFESPPVDSFVAFNPDGSPEAPVTFVIENQGSKGVLVVKADTGRIEVSYP